MLFAAAISRFASTFDGLFSGHLDNDPIFVEIVRQDLNNGQHRNPTGHPAYFTTTFFHLPLELKSEIQEAGFQFEEILPVEGPGWLLPDLEARWNDPARRERFLETLRWIEKEPGLLGTSAHFLAMARKPG